MFALSMLCFVMLLLVTKLTFHTNFYAFSEGELGDLQRIVYRKNEDLNGMIWLCLFGFSIVFGVQGLIIKKLRTLLALRKEMPMSSNEVGLS